MSVFKQSGKLAGFYDALPRINMAWTNEEHAVVIACSTIVRAFNKFAGMEIPQSSVQFAAPSLPITEHVFHEAIAAFKEGRYPETMFFYLTFIKWLNQENKIATHEFKEVFSVEFAERMLSIFKNHLPVDFGKRLDSSLELIFMYPDYFDVMFVEDGFCLNVRRELADKVRARGIPCRPILDVAEENIEELFSVDMFSLAALAKKKWEEELRTLPSEEREKRACTFNELMSPKGRMDIITWIKKKIEERTKEVAEYEAGVTAADNLQYNSHAYLKKELLALMEKYPEVENLEYTRDGKVRIVLDI
ncbi:hypothetical protein SM033_00282 [Vibrio phage vB_VpaM_sm033]|nr:hypothetical protein SM033_00282 [Vibrio phage vB_VpaM_sm033]